MLEFDFTKVQILKIPKIIKKKKNYLLLFMILCYIIPIYYVYNCYNRNNSVSNIICNEQSRNIILFFMGLMGVATILYEIERNDIVSIIMITILLLCVYGLLLYNETNQLHYIFAGLTFITILSFMIRHFCLTNYNKILGLSLLLCISLLLSIIININGNIFYSEVLYILNFAFYYLYLDII
jgi:NADH:ubiquinone oxidoreductase subunit 2 (subunit N)